MKNTIFEKLTQLYHLKVPSNKSINKIHYSAIQQLAFSFYSQYFREHLGLTLNHSLLNLPNRPQSQSTKQAYLSVFYSLPNKKPMIIDFISCLVCLLGDLLLIHPQIYNLPEIQKLQEELCNKNEYLREHLLILFTKITIGQEISKKTASKIFDQIIEHENLRGSTFNSRMMLNYQMKKVKENIKSYKSLTKKRGRRKNLNEDSDHSQQIRQIFQSVKQDSEIEGKHPQQQLILNHKNMLDSTKNKFKSLHIPSQKKKCLKTLRHWKNYVNDLKQNTYTGRVNEDRSYTFLPILKKNSLHTNITVRPLQKQNNQAFEGIRVACTKNKIYIGASKRSSTSSIDELSKFNSKKQFIGEALTKRDKVTEFSILKEKSILFLRKPEEYNYKQKRNRMREQLSKLALRAKIIYNQFNKSDLPPLLDPSSIKQ